MCLTFIMTRILKLKNYASEKFCNRILIFYRVTTKDAETRMLTAIAPAVTFG